MTGVEVHSGWQDDNVRVQDARRPFVRRVRNRLQVAGAPLVSALPSEARMAAGIEAQSYYTYPLLFYSYFPDVSLEQLSALSLCGSYLFDYVLCLDKLLDRSPRGDAGTLLMSHLCQREALARLHALFPPGAPYWNYFDSYDDHFTRAVLLERAQHHCLVSPYSTEALEFIYSGKPAVAKAGIAALALLAGHEELIGPLTASHDAFYVAFQLIDDLQDWRSDYESHQYSYPLTYAFCQAERALQVESEDRPGPQAVAELMESTGTVAHVRAVALRYLDRAAAPLDGLPPSAWLAAIQKTRRRVEHLAFATPETRRTVTSAGAPTLDWETAGPLLALPIAPSWSNWLDPRRAPRATDARVLEMQQAALRAMPRAAGLGEALCQIGLAVDVSYARHPELGLAAHLGLSRGEFEWCTRNERWLQALFVLSLNEPPRLWLRPDDVDAGGGWMPPAVGRYLGYRLMASCPAGAAETEPGGAARIAAALAHFREQLIA